MFFLKLLLRKDIILPAVLVVMLAFGYFSLKKDIKTTIESELEARKLELQSEKENKIEKSISVPRTVQSSTDKLRKRQAARASKQK